MKKNKISIAVITALMLACVSGCSSKEEVSDIENTSSNSVVSEENDIITEQPEEDETVSEEKNNDNDSDSDEYQPSDEIKNAKLNSGLIQIGDTVFQNGCYMTVREFFEKYGDKYDVYDPERNNLDSTFPGEYAQRMQFTSKSDPDIVFFINFDFVPGSPRITGDALVSFFIPSSDKALEFSWEPWDFEKENIRKDLESGNNISFFENNGIAKADFIEIAGAENVKEDEISKQVIYSTKDVINKYGLTDWNYRNNTETYTVCTLGEKPNFYGEKPVFTYRLNIDKNDDTISFYHGNILASTEKDIIVSRNQ